METAITNAPIIINGRRPNLSTVKIASTVNDRFTAPTTICCNKAASVAAPIVLNISGA